MKHAIITRILESLVLLFLVGLSLVLVNQPDGEPAPELFSPWRNEHEVSPGWFLVGIGLLDGCRDRLAVQLRSPDHVNPAIILLTPRRGGACRSRCSRNFELTLDFRLRNLLDDDADHKLEGCPASLRRAYLKVAERLKANDRAVSAERILAADWPTLTIEEPPWWRHYLTPDLPISRIAGSFGLCIAFVWILLLLVHDRHKLFELFVLALLMTLAAVLRLPELSLPFSGDGELHRMAYALFPLEDVLLMRIPEQNHPPLIFLFLRASLTAFGTAEWSARLPFFAAGVASVAAVYWLGRRVVGCSAAALAAWLIAVHPAHIALSLAINDFVFLGLFGTMATAAFITLKERPSRSGAAWLLLWGALTIHANFIGLFWMASLVVWDRFEARRRKRPPAADWGIWGLLLVIALPVISLIASALKSTLGTRSEMIETPELFWGMETLPKQFFMVLLDIFPPPLGLGLGVIFLLSLLRMLRRPYSRARFAPIIWPLVVNVVILVVLGRVVRARPDYFHFLLLSIAIIAAALAVLPLARLEPGLSGFRARAFSAVLGAMVGFGFLCPLDILEFQPTVTPEAPILQIKTELDRGSKKHTVALPASLGAYATYYLCDTLELWEDRVGEGFHDCKEKRRLYSMGLPQAWSGKSPEQLTERLKPLGFSPFYLLFGRYASNELNEWAGRHCRPVVVERDLALMTCRRPLPPPP